ncbi:CMRF35-like molecule 9 [Engraulis encrasicolus]|uniref:CMRF35-like molecule 9 n=1 Tax=Engraulis encrasicolus TaxID=184585 RepID=UPI002FD625F9
MGAALLKAYVGGVVIFECGYKAGDKGRKKIFCKDDDVACYSSPASTGHLQKPSVAMFDTNSNHFLVLMTSLTLKDSGKYWCGVGEPPNYTVTAVHRLDVEKRE